MESMRSDRTEKEEDEEMSRRTTHRLGDILDLQPQHGNLASSVPAHS